MDTIIQILAILAILAPVAILLMVAAVIYFWYRLEGKLKWYNESIQQITEKAILRFQQSTMRIVTECEDDYFSNEHIKIANQTKKDVVMHLDERHPGCSILVYFPTKDSIFQTSFTKTRVRGFANVDSIKGCEPDYIVMHLWDCTPELLRAARAQIGKGPEADSSQGLILCTR